jgi:transposase-like protein
VTLDGRATAQFAGDVGAERCELCADLEWVRYAATSQLQPRPFCSACGRRFPVQQVGVDGRRRLEVHGQATPVQREENDRA